MAALLPLHFIDEVRSDIIDETSYSDNEILTFARKNINKIGPVLYVDATAGGGASVYDFTMSNYMTGDSDYWEIIKLATTLSILEHYKKKLIAEGVGISIGLGSERIDTKTLLNTVKDMNKDASKSLREKIGAYNMKKRQGVSVDLYYSEPTW